MGSRSNGRALLLALVALAALDVQPAQADDHLVRAVKATYLYKFAPFVTWPDDAFPSPQAPLTICVVGDPEMAGLVRRAAADLKIDQRPVAVREPARVETGSDCRILYLGPQATEATRDAVRGEPILTVTDSAHDPRARGIVHFLIHEGRVRFEIDLRLARENRVTISARVLELALRVKRAAGDGVEPARS